jgi:hypothetical protein
MPTPQVTASNARSTQISAGASAEGSTGSIVPDNTTPTQLPADANTGAIKSHNNTTSQTSTDGITGRHPSAAGPLAGGPGSHVITPAPTTNGSAKGAGSGPAGATAQDGGQGQAASSNVFRSSSGAPLLPTTQVRQGQCPTGSG